MIYQSSALVFCALLLTACLTRRLSVFSPPVITGFVWFCVFLIGIIYGDKYFPIADEVFIAWIIWFSINGFASFVFCPSSIPNKNITVYRAVPFYFSYIIMALILWICYKIWGLGTVGSSHFFMNLRLSAIGSDDYESLGLVGRMYPFVFALFIFENIYSRPNNKRLRMLCWAWMLCYAVATMGKFAVLTPIASWCAIRGIKGTLPLRVIFMIGGITLLLMLVIHFVRASDGDEEKLIEMLGLYIYSPIVALGYIENVAVDQYAPYTLRFLYAIGHAIAMNGPPVQTILPYVAIPVETNVYTVLQPFLQDFRITGVLFGSLIYFILFGVIYYFAHRQSGYAIGLYASLYISLITQTFAETIFTNLSGNLQVVIFLSLIYLLSRKENHVCRHIDGHIQRFKTYTQSDLIPPATNI